MKELKQPTKKWRRFQIGNRTKEATVLRFVNKMGYWGWEFMCAGANKEGKYRIFHFRAKPYNLK